MAHNITTAVREATALLGMLKSIKEIPEVSAPNRFLIAEISDKLQTYNHHLSNLATEREVKLYRARIPRP